MEKVIRGIIEILETARTAAASNDPLKNVKTIFFGDPVIIAESMLPSIVVMPVSESVSSRGTQYDQADATIRIKLIQNLKETLGASSTDTENVKMTEIAVKTFEERDSNGKVKPTTVIGALRSNPELPYQGEKTCEWNGSFNIEYGFTDAR